MTGRPELTVDYTQALASRGPFNRALNWPYKRTGTWDRLRGRGRHGVPGRAKRQRGYNHVDKACLHCGYTYNMWAQKRLWHA